jgi:3-methyladenine DNA glycosylase AlkC
MGLVKSIEEYEEELRDNLYYADIPPEILDELAKDKQPYIRWSVAKNIHTPVKTLDRLANDEMSYIKLAVAQNPNTSTETLERLAGDKDSEVRQLATANLNRRNR